MAHAEAHVCFPLIRNDTDIVTVKELLRHTTIVLTMRYTHTNDEAKTHGANRIMSSEGMVEVTPKPRRTRQ